MLTKWIIAIGNTEADGVRMFYAIGNVDQIKRALVELALEDKGNDKESFNYGTEDMPLPSAGVPPRAGIWLV